MDCIFAHGFEGRPDGTKPTHLKRLLGGRVVAPSMHAKGWTFEGHVSVVLEHIDQNPDINLIAGSSMGGFASAVAASRRAERSLKLLLFAPAFGIHRSWAQQWGELGMAQWEKTGLIRHFHQGVQSEIEIPYAFWEQCRDHDGVTVDHQTVIIHGLHDDIVPMENVVAVARRSPGVERMIVVNDGHRLHESLNAMEEGLRHLGAV